MLHFVLRLSASIQKYKNKKKEKVTEAKKIFESKKDGYLEDRLAKSKEDTTKKDKIKYVLLKTLANIVAFFETLPLFSVIIMWSFFIVIILGGIMATIIILPLLNSIADGKFNFSEEKPSTEEAKGTGTIQWTQEELDAKGGTLTDYEKNLYRMGIFARKAIEGYGGKALLTGKDGNGDKDLAIVMDIGIASIESSMQFYNNSSRHDDITKVPSDKGLNSLGYGMMGLKGSDNLEMYFGKNASRIRAEYPFSGGYSYENQCMPWSVAMTTAHFNGKMTSIVYPNCDAPIDKAFKEWGIVANQDKIRTLIELFLGQAQYHGAYPEDYDGYINFWCAMYVSTSDKDEERSFDKWTIEGKSFSESEFRKCVLGSTPYESIGSTSTPANLPSGSSGVKLCLDGKPIGKPLWTFLWEKHSGKPGMQQAWEKCRYFHNGVQAFNLNFGYGVNSYLQGLKIKNQLIEKMGLTASGGSTVSAGKSVIVPTGNKQVDELLGHAFTLIGLGYHFGGSGVKVITPGSYDMKTGKFTNGTFEGNWGTAYNPHQGETLYEWQPANKGFDCSAYVQWCYAQLGISIPRNTFGQRDGWGKKIYNKADLKPGDIVIVNNTLHVVLYLGDGKVLEEPQSAGTKGNEANGMCKVNNLNNFSFVRGVRYIGW